MMLPLRSRIHRGRRYLSRLVSQPEPPPEPSLVWSSSVPVDGMLNRARRRFRADPPPAPDGTATFRAAGASRLPFPTGDARFSDVEDEHAWNRLYWTLQARGGSWIGELERWLDTPLSDAARRPYTTSERICTLAQVLGRRAPELPTDLVRRIAGRVLSDASWLLEHVETRLGAHNHILNNARALFVAALVLDDGRSSADWLARARQIWDEFWPRLILEDGVFAEQSTHYHVMMTRTLLDYLDDARLSGRSLPEGMTEKARAMCRVTNSLIRSDGSLPLFGDISPDLPVAWLRGLPRVCERGGMLDEPPRDPAAGYAGGADDPSPDEAGRPSRPPGRAAGEWTARLFPAGGLMFAFHPEASLELAVHGDPRPTSSCHGDTGRGSFEIWFRGRRVVVDGGVATYEAGETRDRFRGPEGQNVVSIDGLAPVLLMDQARELPGWYVDALEGGAWEMDSNRATFVWRGFRRLRPGLTWVRTFRWSGLRVEIGDRIEGWTGEADVEARMHFGERGWVRRSSSRFGIDGCDVQVELPRGLTATLVGMPHASDYGALVEAEGIRLTGRLRLPTSWSWSVEVEPPADSHARPLA